ncbi:uncharacterized protein LOC127259337 isoform X2 [Andrographis paniculata]|uniref:uncharacterized protein LOC127259337 isoform X2 n=1 Tax=Andrographis paniculata TaxID=175694 RepID=UPI0021E9413A|nr:uncharacterized protein LOC127259337 isoform X2 [Andrographis paniculata]
MACSSKAHNEFSVPHSIQSDSSEVIRFIVVPTPDFSQALNIPSAIAPILDHLLGQEIEFEDICREKWTVTFSYAGNVLSVVKGWNNFYRDHDLGEACALAFSYIKGSHFYVAIYDRSACERTKFNYEMPRVKNHGSQHVDVQRLSEMELPHQTQSLGKSEGNRDPVSKIQCGKRKGKEPIIRNKHHSKTLDAGASSDDANASSTTANPDNIKMPYGKRKGKEPIIRNKHCSKNLDTGAPSASVNASPTRANPDNIKMPSGKRKGKEPIIRNKHRSKNLDAGAPSAGANASSTRANPDDIKMPYGLEKINKRKRVGVLKGKHCKPVVLVSHPSEGDGPSEPTGHAREDMDSAMEDGTIAEDSSPGF